MVFRSCAVASTGSTVASEIEIFWHSPFPCLQDPDSWSSLFHVFLLCVEEGESQSGGRIARLSGCSSLRHPSSIRLHSHEGSSVTFPCLLVIFYNT
jgi:hypothetical protein